MTCFAFTAVNRINCYDNTLRKNILHRHTTTSLARRLICHLQNLIAIHMQIYQHMTQDYNFTINIQQLLVDNRNSV